MSDDDFLLVEANDCPMSSCAAPAGSPCRTGRGKVAAQYHTARFRLVPRLAKALNVPVPPVRKPGTLWIELPRPAAAGAQSSGRVRIGYARASTARQSLDVQLDSLKAAGVTKVFAEKVSTRAVQRPELDKAVEWARELRTSGLDVTLVVHEHKRLGRGLQLAELAEQLRSYGVALEFLTGELQGSHDPGGIVFTVLAALSGMEREYIRERTLEGHESARARGKTIGGAAVGDEAMLSMALHLRGQGKSLREIAAGLVITKGKKKGQHPSPATVMRMLRDHDTVAAASAVPVQGSLERGTSAVEVVLRQPVGTAVGVDIEGRVRDVYWTLARYPQDWVYLSQIRTQLEGVDRDVIDDVLRRMERLPDVHLVPEADQKLLTPAERAAAVAIGGTPKHLLAMEHR